MTSTLDEELIIVSRLFSLQPGLWCMTNLVYNEILVEKLYFRIAACTTDSQLAATDIELTFVLTHIRLHI